MNNSTNQEVSNIPTKDVDLLGIDDDSFTSSAQASNDFEFGEFQQAITISQPNSFDPFAPMPTSDDLDLFSIQPTSGIGSICNNEVESSSKNLWSSFEGKLDISLNNLVPHTRGSFQKKSFPINQISSPTNINNSILSSQIFTKNQNNQS